MKSLLTLLALSVLTGSLCVDAFKIWFSRDYAERLRPTLHKMRQQSLPTYLDEDYTDRKTRSDNSPQGLLGYDLIFGDDVQVAPPKRSVYVRDPQWRPCLRTCYAGCSAWEDANIKYCAQECMKWGLNRFRPDDYCFDIGQP